jgi:hypothetical protein
LVKAATGRAGEARHHHPDAVVAGDATRAIARDGCVVRVLEHPGDVGVDAQGGGVGRVSGDAGVLADREPESPAVDLGSSTAISGASGSYPVRESSGNATTRASADRTASACVAAFAATSYGTHGGWAAAMVRGLGAGSTLNQRARQDSNLRPRAPEARALSPELRALYRMSLALGR